MAEVVAVVAAEVIETGPEVIETVPEVIGMALEVIKMVFVVVGNAHTIVTVLQARRTHLHFNSMTWVFITSLHQRLRQEDPPILGW